MGGSELRQELIHLVDMTFEDFGGYLSPKSMGQ